MGTEASEMHLSTVFNKNRELSAGRSEAAHDRKLFDTPTGPILGQGMMNLVESSFHSVNESPRSRVDSLGLKATLGATMETEAPIPQAFPDKPQAILRGVHTLVYRTSRRDLWQKTGYPMQKPWRTNASL